MNEMTMLMNEHTNMWLVVTTTVPCVRPRTCVIVWAINEALDKDWNVLPYREDDPLWDSIREYMLSLVRMFDHVGVICPGSAAIWVAWMNLIYGSGAP